MTRVETRLRSELVPLLRLPKIYPERPASVELQETHTAWLFLTDRYVYKLKKPLYNDSLDFRMPDRRRHACLPNTDAYDSAQHHWIAALQPRVPLIDMAVIELNTMKISEALYLSQKLRREVTAAQIEQRSKSTAVKRL